MGILQDFGGEVEKFKNNLSSFSLTLLIQKKKKIIKVVE